MCKIDVNKLLFHGFITTVRLNTYTKLKMCPNFLNRHVA